MYAQLTVKIIRKKARTQLYIESENATSKDMIITANDIGTTQRIY